MRLVKATVLIISSTPWHATWQRHHDIAWGLADRDYRVLYLEPLPKRWPGPGEWRRVLGRLTGSSEMAGYCRQEEHPGVQLVSPRTLPDAGVGGLGSRANARFLVPRLAAELRALNLARPLVIINYLPTPAARELARRLAPDLFIYDCVWDWANAPNSSSLQASEQAMMSEVDMVFADSPYLIEKMRRLHVNVYPVLPAVHIDRFAAGRAATPVTRVRSRCAYFGTIGLAIDAELLRRVSHRYPLRLIGPARQMLQGFAEDTDIYGPRPHDEVAGLLSDVDVLLLPYSRQVSHNKAVIPAKTFECLATGKPTVAMGLESLRQFGELFYLAQTEEQFMEMIARAADEDPGLVEQRLACARANTWERRIEEIVAHIEAGLESIHRG